MFRSRVFTVLYGAEVQSVAGDQLARIALSVLVFRRTASPTATALTYAATYVPAILGGWLLAGIGDRLPRRTVMIGCDLVRAVLFALMAIAALPLVLVIGLLIVAVFLGPAFAASEVSYLAAALDAERFRVATGLRMITSQVAQVGGFAVGGLVVGWLGPRPALLIEAATFLVSAGVIRVGLRGRSASGHDSESGRPESGRPESARPESGRPDSARPESGRPESGRPESGRPESGRPESGRAEPLRSGAPMASASAGVDSVPQFVGLWRTRRTRILVLLSSLAGFFVVPEGLAVPFGHDVGATTAQTGLLLASVPLGGAVGSVVLLRAIRAPRRRPVSQAMVVACGLPLLVTALEPPWPVAVGSWFLSGALAAYQVETTSSLVQAIPDSSRSRALGVVSAVLLGAQGAGLVIFGIVAHSLTSAHSIALAGLLGSAAAAALVWIDRRGAREENVGKCPPSAAIDDSDVHDARQPLPDDDTSVPADPRG